MAFEEIKEGVNIQEELILKVTLLTINCGLLN
jgi:hypothetical protein